LGIVEFADDEVETALLPEEVRALVEAAVVVKLVVAPLVALVVAVEDFCEWDAVELETVLEVIDDVCVLLSELLELDEELEVTEGVVLVVLVVTVLPVRLSKSWNSLIPPEVIWFAL
jgi:hypothetical protein